MNYTVRWLKAAEEQLRLLWTQVPDANALADAADAVNAILKNDPYTQGESRGAMDRRLWFHLPLCVLFRIDNPTTTVFVDGIRWIGPR